MKITPFRKLAALVAISVALLALVAPAFAYISSYSVDYYDYDSNILAYNHPSSQVYPSAIGFTFMATGTSIENVIVYGRMASNPTDGVMTGKLAYLTDDTMPEGSEPNATVIATSTNTIWVNTTTFSYQQLMFTFTPVSVTSGANYSFYIQLSEITQSFSKGVEFEWDHTSPVGVGNAALYFSSGWQPVNDDMIHYIYAENEYTGGGGVIPPGTIPFDPANYDSIISAFISFIVPLIVLLLPALLLMFLTRRADKWLLIIGITIGAGLGYYFGMVPLWLVFLVTIGLIGMAYQSVRGGGDN